MLEHQARRKAVVAGGDGRVRREHGLERDLAVRREQGDALGGGPLARDLERSERAVPLIEVQHAGADTESVQHADAPDTEQQLLPNSHPLVSTIELRRELTAIGRIPLHVGVEEKQRRPADFGAPRADA